MWISREGCFVVGPGWCARRMVRIAAGRCTGKSCIHYCLRLSLWRGQVVILAAIPSSQGHDLAWHLARHGRPAMCFHYADGPRLRRCQSMPEGRAHGSGTARGVPRPLGKFLARCSTTCVVGRHVVCRSALPALVCNRLPGATIKISVHVGFIRLLILPNRQYLASTG